MEDVANITSLHDDDKVPGLVEMRATDNEIPLNWPGKLVIKKEDDRSNLDDSFPLAGRERVEQ